MEDDRNRIIAELDHIREYFEAKANMSVGKGKMLLCYWANVVGDAIKYLAENVADG